MQPDQQQPGQGWPGAPTSGQPASGAPTGPVSGAPAPAPASPGYPAPAGHGYQPPGGAGYQAPGGYYAPGAAGYQAPGRPSRRISVADALVGAGGLLIFLFSFAPFVGYDEDLVDLMKDSTDKDFSGWYMAWSTHTFMAPLTWWVIFAGMALAGLAVVRIMRGGNPSKWGVSAVGLQVGLSLFAFFVLIGYAFSAKEFTFGIDLSEEMKESIDANPAFQWGGFLMLLGSIVAVAGALMNHLGYVPALAVSAQPQGQVPGYGANQPQQQYPQQQYPQQGHPQQQYGQQAYPQQQYPQTGAYPQAVPYPQPQTNAYPQVQEPGDGQQNPPGGYPPAS